MSVQIIGALTQRQLPKRTQPIQAAIVHTTGDTDLAKAMRFYGAPDGLQPHYVIDVAGVIYRIAWDHQVAWHCKIDPAEARLYQLGYGEWSTWTWRDDRPVHLGNEFPGYRFWRAQWVGLQSPLELVTADHPNSVSLGIELQQPARPTADIFTDAQYEALAQLLVDIHEREGVVLDRWHLLGHQDCSPMRRSNAAGGWDPGQAFNWNRAWDLLGTTALVT